MIIIVCKLKVKEKILFFLSFLRRNVRVLREMIVYSVGRLLRVGMMRLRIMILEWEN